MGDKSLEGAVYEFDCPVHGPERGAFCFRAWQAEYLDRWSKYEVTLRKVPCPLEEIREWVEQCTKRYSQLSTEGVKDEWRIPFTIGVIFTFGLGVAGAIDTQTPVWAWLISIWFLWGVGIALVCLPLQFSVFIKTVFFGLLAIWNERVRGWVTEL